jgi:hypothetical protein
MFDCPANMYTFNTLSLLLLFVVVVAVVVAAVVVVVVEVSLSLSLILCIGSASSCWNVLIICCSISILIPPSSSSSSSNNNVSLLLLLLLLLMLLSFASTPSRTAFATIINDPNSNSDEHSGKQLLIIMVPYMQCCIVSAYAKNVFGCCAAPVYCQLVYYQGIKFTEKVTEN